jgi:hypothetical protein
MRSVPPRGSGWVFDTFTISITLTGPTRYREVVLTKLNLGHNRKLSVRTIERLWNRCQHFEPRLPVELQCESWTLDVGCWKWLRFDHQIQSRRRLSSIPLFRPSPVQRHRRASLPQLHRSRDQLPTSEPDCLQPSSPVQLQNFQETA